MAMYDTQTMTDAEVNPRSLIQFRRVFADAQYKVPQASRVMTRIELVAHVYNIRRRNTNKQTREQRMNYMRQLGIDFHSALRILNHGFDKGSDDGDDPSGFDGDSYSVEID